MIYKEINKKEIGGQILSSKLVEATEEEVLRARKDFLCDNVCDHSFVEDVAGYMYDYRNCVVCGAGLGNI